jgi:hypothetical protein
LRQNADQHGETSRNTGPANDRNITGIAAAHGEGQHVFGTITALDTAEIQVLTIKGKTVSIHTVAETKYRNKGRRGGGNVPKVGDRVAVDVTEKDGKLMATEVQFSSSANP